MAEAASEALSAAVCIAIVGAESTGKTQLAADLAQALSHHTGRRVAWVPEMLRSWCERTGRTPQAHEQAPILRAQHEQIDAAAASHEFRRAASRRGSERHEGRAGQRRGEERQG